MKIEEVAPGMLLVDPLTTDVRMKIITVTELTERGFKYSYAAPVCVHPRLGITYAKDGHEAYAIDGRVRYEIAP